MFECIRSRIEQQIEKLRRRFGQVEGLSLGEILSSELVEQVVREEVGVHRQRLFPPASDVGDIYRAGAER